jgi:hypothetical protein
MTDKQHSASNVPVAAPKAAAAPPQPPQPPKSVDAHAAAAAKAAKLAPPPAQLPPDFDFDFDPASVPHLAAVAAAAWDAVKGHDDAPFAAAAGTFQHELLAHAKSALTTQPQGGPTAQAKFERKVAQMKLESLKTAKVKE